MKADIEKLPMMVTYHRLKAELSQQQLADKCGVSRHFIIRLENGEDNLGLDHIKEVLKALRINCFLSPKGNYQPKEK